jgi:hypothetical protein
MQDFRNLFMSPLRVFKKVMAGDRDHSGQVDWRGEMGREKKKKKKKLPTT